MAHQHRRHVEIRQANHVEKTDKPLFIYALTMYEHGPYDEKHSDDYHLANYVKNSGSAGEFSHYVEK